MSELPLYDVVCAQNMDNMGPLPSEKGTTKRFSGVSPESDVRIPDTTVLCVPIRSTAATNEPGHHWVQKQTCTLGPKFCERT